MTRTDGRRERQGSKKDGSKALEGSDVEMAGVMKERGIKS